MKIMIKGLLTPNCTPFNADLSINEELYIEHAQKLLAEGSDGLVPFGSTSEALSLSIEERVSLLEKTIAAGVPATRLIPGVGLCNYLETARLIEHAMNVGCEGVLILPPFYYKGVSDEALARYFDKLLELVTRNCSPRLYLYHIPPIAQVGFSFELTAELKRRYPEYVVGYKDSSGDWNNTERLIEEIAGLAVYSGSEQHLATILRLGSGGTITATGNMNSVRIGELRVNWDGSDGEALQASVSRTREIIQRYPLIAATKWLLARSSGEPRWKITRPPLESLPDELGERLWQELRQEGQ